jgi:hypothetical protein
MFGEYLYVYILRGIIMNKKYPIPTMEEPDEEQLEEWVYDSVCDALMGVRLSLMGYAPMDTLLGSFI